MRDFGGKVRFVSENYGDSEVARKFGVTRYPAIFVDDVLVASPKDFGFYGKGEGSGDGRYTPLKSAGSHERFRADLSRMISLVLALLLLPATAFGAARPDTSALHFRGFRAGARLDELDSLLRRQGGRLRCDHAKKDPKVSECRGRVTDSATGSTNVWVSASTCARV